MSDQPVLTFKTAWQQDDPHAQSVAVDFWRTHNLLPAGIDPTERAGQLCVLAYDDDELVGVSTLELAHLKQLRRDFLFFRCSTAPGRRHEHIATALTEVSGRVAGTWARANLELEIAGFAAVIESPDLAPLAQFPVWPVRQPELTNNAGLNLVGYTREGHQVRVAWFYHVTV